MSPIRMSKIESVIRVVLELFHEAFNRHDVAGMMQLMHDDCSIESFSPAPGGAVYTGKGAVGEYWLEFFKTFPNSHLEIEDIFGMGKRCVMRWTQSWMTNEAEQATVRGASLFLLVDSVIREQFSYIKGTLS